MAFSITLGCTDVSRYKSMFYQVLSDQARLRSDARHAADEFRLRHEELDDQLDLLDGFIREAMFIEYCNTPCWRYRC